MNAEVLLMLLLFEGGGFASMRDAMITALRLGSPKFPAYSTASNILVPPFMLLLIIPHLLAYFKKRRETDIAK